jgi:uncharacterized membrane protein YdfJ with MMPL/SSD domain
MRCKRLIAVLLAAVFLLGTVVPAIADDGKRHRFLEEKLKDHPWQDDSSSNSGSSAKTAKRPLGIAIGPIIVTVHIAIPFTQRPSQAPLVPANNATTQTNVEKGK